MMMLLVGLGALCITLMLVIGLLLDRREDSWQTHVDTAMWLIDDPDVEKRHWVNGLRGAPLDLTKGCGSCILTK